MKILQATNRFYFGVIALMIALAVLVIVVLRGVFGAVTIAGEIDDKFLGSTTPRLDRAKIDEALDSVSNKEFTPLDL